MMNGLNDASGLAGEAGGVLASGAMLEDGKVNASGTVTETGGRAASGEPSENGVPAANPQLVLLKLCVRRLYDAQKLRIQSELRFQRFEREGIQMPAKIEARIIEAKALDVSAEELYQRAVADLLKDLPIWQNWLKYVKGVGPRLGGSLIGVLWPMTRFATVSKVWAYCGLDVRDGRLPKYKKGEQANWNAEMRMTCYKLGEQFLRNNSPYRRFYDVHKKRVVERELAKGTIRMVEKEGVLKPEYVEKPERAAPAHFHAMSRLRMVKIFLSHLWQVGWELEGLTPPKPWVIEHGGHVDFVSPWEMVDSGVANENGEGNA